MDDLLYPELSEQGKNDAQMLLDKFKERMKKVCEETLSQMYYEIGSYIESDSWTNYRNSIMNGLKNYKDDRRYDYKQVRSEILKEHREEIIKDLNQDLLEEIENLKGQIKQIYERRTY